MLKVRFSFASQLQQQERIFATEENHVGDLRRPGAISACQHRSLEEQKVAPSHRTSSTWQEREREGTGGLIEEWPYFCVRMVTSLGLPISLSLRSKSGLKYSSGVMAVGLFVVAYSVVRSCGKRQRIRWVADSKSESKSHCVVGGTGFQSSHVVSVLPTQQGCCEDRRQRGPCLAPEPLGGKARLLCLEHLKSAKPEP